MACDTKNSMKNSLKKLIQKKPLNKITISDITSDCGINRMTFYYHFKDIYDLLEWCITSDANIASKEAFCNNTWENELLSIMNICLRNKEFYLPLFRSMDRELAERYILKFSMRISDRIIDSQLAKSVTPPELKKRISEYYAFTITGVITCWTLNEMLENPESIVKYMHYLFENTANTLHALHSDTKIQLSCESDPVSE